MPVVTTTEIHASKLREQGYTLQQIGDRLDVSRQRADQLLRLYRLKKRLGIFSELLTRSLSVLQNLNITTLGQLRERFPEFKNHDGCILKYKFRGCGDLVYEDLAQFLKRHKDKPDSVGIKPYVPKSKQ